MSEDVLRYDQMVEQALRDVVRQALGAVASAGLPGEHHFYITFRTTAPGVQLAKRLREKYAEEMTIVVQHEFWDLQVEAERFAISLSFDGSKERIVVPYAALVSFADPSVNFGLKFQSAGGTADENGAADTGGGAPPPATVADEAPGADVVSLDAFRSK